MKPHLPKALLTSLIGAAFACNLFPAVGGELTTSSFLYPVGDTTYTFSGTKQIESNYDTTKPIGSSDTYFTVNGITYTGAQSTATGPFVASGGSDCFWKNLTNDDHTGAVYGQTLLMKGSTTATQQLNNNGMGNMAIGGLITEDNDSGTSSYILNGADGNSNLTLVANASAGMNMYIGANTEIRVGGTGQLIAATDGTWTVNSGKTLTLRSGTAGAVVFQSNINVTGGGMLSLKGGNATVRNGATLTVSDGMILDRVTVESGGTLDLTGTVDIAMNGDAESGTEVARARENGNGFGVGTYSANISDYITGDGSVDTSGVTGWRLNGHDVTKGDDNTLSYTGEGRNTYYIFSTENVGDYSDARHLVVDIGTRNTYDFGSSANTTLESISIKSGTMTSRYAGGETAFMQGDIDIGAGAELKFTGGRDMLGWNSTNTKTISLAGEEGNVAKLTFAYSGNGSATMKTNLNLKGYALVSGGTLSAFGGTITATGTDNIFASTLELREALTVDVTGSSDSLLIRGNITSYTDSYGSNFTGTLTKTGAGQLEITGNINGGNKHTINGGNTTTITSASIQDVTIHNATLSSLTGQNLSGAVNLSNIGLDSILTVANGGTLTLTGSVDIATNVAAASGTEVARIRKNGNGFGSGKYSVNISDYITGDGSVNTSGVTGWSLNGNNVIKGEDNTLSYTGEGRNTYYIYNATAEADYGKAKHLIVDVVKGNTYNFGTSANTTLESMTIKSGKVTTKYVGPSEWNDPNYGDAFMRGDITIEAGGELQLAGAGAGANDALGWNEHATKSISLRGSEGEGNEAKLTLAYTGTTGSATLKTNLNLNGNALVSGCSFNSYGAEITATGNSNTIESGLQLRQALTVNVEDASQLTISGEIRRLTYGGESSYNATLTKEGTGSLSITGTINGDNIVETEADGVTIDGGNSTTISSATIQYATIKNATLGSANEQTPSVTMSLTNVTLGGTINITGCTATYTAGTAEESKTLKFAGDAVTVKISQGATLKHDGFDYTAQDGSSTPASIQSNGETSLKLHQGEVSISNVSMEKTSTDDGKHISIELDNVDLTLNCSGSNDNKLFGDKTQSLSNLTVNGGTLDVESAATVSGTTTIADGATVVIMNAGANLGSVTGAGTVESQKNVMVKTIAADTSTQTTGFTGTLKATGNTTLTDAGSGSGFNVEATDGDIVLLNRATEVTLQSLVLGSGHSLTIGGSTAQILAVAEADAAPATSPGVKVTGTGTLEGGSTIVGGLNLTSTDTLTINNVASSPIMLSGTLTLPTGGITLGGDILGTLGGLAKDGTLNVFQGVTSLTLGGTDYTGVTDLTNYFTFDGLEAGSYSLGYTGVGDGGFVYIQKNVPEPTTATLSLLALAALAARRRRKN